MYEVTTERVKAAKELVLGFENQMVARMLSVLPNELIPAHEDVLLMLDAFAEKYPARFVSQVCTFEHDEVVLT